MLNNLVTVDVPVDMSVSSDRRTVSMRFSFGGTELGITCKRNSDGKEVKVDTIYIEDIEDTSLGRAL